MIWLFERGDPVARLVTRGEPDDGVHVLEMEWSDGLVTTEIRTLEPQLVAEEWKPAGNAPQLIAEDWWKPRLPLHLRCHAR